MNFRNVIHFLKTDWQCLRWLVVGCWVLALIAAWPVLTFSPGRFDNPPSMRFLIYREDSIESTLMKQGEISLATDWFFESAGWMLTAVSLILAGALGFHARNWTEGRPVRRAEAFAARTASLAIFLTIPLLAVAPVASLVHGFGVAAASDALLESAAALVPRLLAVCLFGSICGGWTRWISGMFAFVIALMVVPLVLGIGMGSPWIFPSLTFGGSYLSHGWQAWLAVAILGAVLILTSRQMNAWRRIGLTLAAVVVLPSLVYPFFPPSVDWGKLPDWSASVEPELVNSEFAGTITSDPDSIFQMSFRTLNRKPRLQLDYQLKTKGLPAGVFADWDAVGSGSLISGDQIISSRFGGGQIRRMDHATGPGGFNQQALTAAVSPDGKAVEWKDFHFSTPSKNETLFDLFDPIEEGEFKSARLETELKGRAYRIVKLLDVPFGPPAEATIEGVRIHVRRLDLVDSWPVADLCYVAPDSSNLPAGRYRRKPWQFDWIPVLYFPETGVYQLLDHAYASEAELSAGCLATRRMYWACHRVYGRKPDTKGLKTARFLLLRRENLAVLSKQFRSATLPLAVQNEVEPADRRAFREPPPFQLRPDPATATAREFDQWQIRSLNDFDPVGWDSRNLADFVPRHLDRLLRQGNSVYPPSIPGGKAIALACPESRRDEVIAALLRPNADPQANWISDVILRRGWVREAAPQIREMAAQGKIGNPYSQIMTMRLEDPQTYAAILDQPLWLDIYEQARRLPGVEPALTESLLRRSQKEPDGDARMQMDQYLAATAHGIPEAFSKLLKVWQTAPDQDRGVYGDYLRQMIAIPGNRHDRRRVVAELADKTAADFRYDTLARLWVPVSPTSN